MNYVCFGYHLVNKQWGNNNTAYIQTNFPMQFPNKLFVVLLSLYSNPGSRDTGSNVETYERGQSGYKSWYGNRWGGNPDKTLQHFYIVIGC